MTESSTENKSQYEADRLTELESDLNRLQRQLKREAQISLTLTVLVLAALTGYFIYGYLQVTSIMQPKDLVAVAAQVVDSNIPTVRQGIESEISQSAPIWAEQLSQQAIAAAPALREELEGYVVDQTEASIEQFVDISRQEFRQALTEHHDEFESLIKDLSSRQQASDEVVDAIEVALNAELGTNMQASSTEVLKTVEQINQRMMHLSVGNQLAPREQLERQALMLVRRIQMQEAEKMPSSGEQGLLGMLTTGVAADSEPPARDAGAGAPSIPPTMSTPSDAASDFQTTAVGAVADNAAARLVEAEAAEASARQAEERIRAATREQEQAAEAARAATDLAREAASQARIATQEARLARDELREAERAARAAIEELKALQSAAGEDKVVVEETDVRAPQTTSEETAAESPTDESATEDSSSDPNSG